MTSSAIDETMGTIITPITTPAASALSDETSKPTASELSRTKGATTSTAKKP